MPRPLAVGIQLPEVERVVRWPEYAAMARAAEETGFDSVWVGDHLLYRGDGAPERGQLEAWTLLAGLASMTSRVKLGPLVACIGFHEPGILAKMALTVDDISAGRLILGIGAGWNVPDFEAFGLPYDHRASRFEEAFTILRALLAGERVSFEGTYHHAQDLVALPTPERRIPLMLGSNGDRMLSIGLPHVDAWNTWYDDFGNTAAGFEALNTRITDAARKAGRDPAEIRRSVCLFSSLEGPNTRIYDKPFDPVPRDPDAIAAHIRALADAGAHEAIIVVEPTTEATIRGLGAVLALLDR